MEGVNSVEKKFQVFGNKDSVVVCFFCSLVIWLLFCLFIIACKQKQQKNYFSTIDVDKEKRTIEFEAKLNLDNKEKYFLFYFEGYPWIKENCLFVSSSTLKDLQNSVAFIDWQLWDKIYTKNFSPKIEVEIFLPSEGWTNLEKILKIKNFDSYQTIFWGSNAYDSIVLERNYKTSKCSSCELLPLEKDLILGKRKVLNYKFIKNLPKDANLKIRIKFL